MAGPSFRDIAARVTSGGFFDLAHATVGSAWVSFQRELLALFYRRVARSLQDNGRGRQYDADAARCAAFLDSVATHLHALCPPEELQPFFRSCATLRMSN